MITDPPPKFHNAQNEQLRERGKQQAAVIGKYVVEGLAISPAVIDEFLVSHGLGHVVIEVTDVRLDPHVLLEELQNVA